MTFRESETARVLAGAVAALLIVGELCIWLLRGVLLLILVAALAWVALTIAERWDAPEYPHSGFQPDCPEWVAGASMW